MNLSISERVKPLIADIHRYIQDYVVPNEKAYADQVNAVAKPIGERWIHNVDQSDSFREQSENRDSTFTIA